jgi:hypothetical protein
LLEIRQASALNRRVVDSNPLNLYFPNRVLRNVPVRGANGTRRIT